MARLNQRTLIVMFSETGPVSELMEFRAREVVGLARDNVREIMHKFGGNIESIADAIDYEVLEAGPGEVEILIGVRNDGPIAQYLAQKEDREQVILEPAVEQVFG